MASVDYQKLKTMQEVKALMRHCDREERTATQEHANKQIDKTKTGENTQIKGRSYKQTCKRLDDRLKKLDSLPGANLRKDRVLCFGLEIPCPADISRENQLKWVHRVYQIVADQYGKDNIMNMYFHRDEIHQYIDSDTGEPRTSLAHLHFFVVPEINGKLNGKQFSSRANMTKLNDAIHKMTQEEFEVDFLTGTKTKSKDSVETLKNKSAKKAIQVQRKELEAEKAAVERKGKGVQVREAAVQVRENAVEARESAVAAREADVAKDKQEYTILCQKAVKREKKAKAIFKEAEDLYKKVQEREKLVAEREKAVLYDENLQKEHHEALQKRLEAIEGQPDLQADFDIIHSQLH